MCCSHFDLFRFYVSLYWHWFIIYISLFIIHYFIDKPRHYLTPTFSYCSELQSNFSNSLPVHAPCSLLTLCIITFLPCWLANKHYFFFPSSFKINRLDSMHIIHIHIYIKGNHENNWRRLAASRHVPCIGPEKPYKVTLCENTTL